MLGGPAGGGAIRSGGRPLASNCGGGLRMASQVELDSLSYWEDSSSVSRYPALDRDLTVDVVVIGAGITGLTAAYLLKRSGKKVAVIDRRRCGGVDSSRTTAHVTGVTDVALQTLVK